MAKTYYVCYNQISYLVASEHARQSGDKNATILFGADRVLVQTRYAGTTHRQLNRGRLAHACVLGLLTRRTTVYVPHHRTSRLVRLLAWLARSKRLVDDGLDTLRERPNNIDIDRLDAFDELLTFTDYPRLAQWTERLPVTRVCSLEVLDRDDRPPMTCERFNAIVVQSPGVDIGSATRLVDLEPARVLVFTHRNPTKRASIPRDCQQADAGMKYSLERTVNAFAGTVLSGDTMVTVHMLFRPGRSRLVIQLSRKQYDNLASLHTVIAASGARLLVS